MKKYILKGFLFLFATVSLAQQKQKNILFIAVDDLKPLINAYGENQMKTPNFDRLIKSGVMFENAEVQQAVCGPSRASVMTGTYPDRTKVWDLHTDFRESSPTLVSMPEYLISQGYTTTAVGKIYHKGSTAPGHDGKSWSIPHVLPENFDPKYGTPSFSYYQDPATKAEHDRLMKEAEAQGKKPGQQRTYAFKKLKPSTESADVSDEAYQDGIYTVEAIKRLDKLAKEAKPFFLGVGFQKPHLPFVAPKKYWDLYDRSKISLAPNQKLIDGTPDFAYQTFGELRAFTDIDNNTKLGEPLPEAKQRELIHGYMACVSYVDAQLGKLLDELDRLKITNETVIVLWGDHGYHLGDHTMWNKHSNFEQATRIPFIFSGPGVTKGKKVTTPVELIDLFPTVFELAGVKQSTQTDGKSLVPVLDNDPKTNLKVDYALSQYPRQNGKIMGYSIRTERYRYTEWHGNNYNASTPYDASNIVAVELYDFKTDPTETKNHAKDASNKQLVDELQAKVKSKVNHIYERNKVTPAVAYEKKPKEGGDEEGVGANKKQGAKKDNNTPKKGGKNKKKTQE
ncbi:sulfatase-like hydrolase/transferase [Flavobacterium sp. LMO8]|uniref:sulfatase n=1 Tax=Flavobacterium sp. LMO8 TaxID=2654244 RepID=UPI0012922A71|nr:sulfatase [Flavobacterium sp. LMO8]MQP25658.1 sulfatase-like hydrolase/transferase [Flavobacterium sp. LMO8]